VRITPLTHLRVPLGAQEIELQEVLHEAGGMALLRIRIREGKRFTIFDIDADSARAWADAMLQWAATTRSERGAEPPA
jgi:hypothetical protein